MQSKKVSPVSGEFNIDDYIGIESCVDLRENHFEAEMSSSASGKRDSKMWGMRRSGKREFPPPIPLLVRTENPASHMPWVLKRHYTGDGRLILTEERVSHHEFFLAHRSDGRLMLQLVAFDDRVSDESNAEIGDEDQCAAAAEGGSVVSMGMWGKDPAFMFRVAVPVGSPRTVRT